MFYVYVLQSAKSGGYYVGYTEDLKKRLKEHNSGQNKSTKASVPWEVIFYEAYGNQEDALRRERYLKTTQGRQAIRRMLKNYLADQAEYFDY